jgi:integrase
MTSKRGTLVLRGANFYARWCYQGKFYVRRLSDELGQPITREKEARKAMAVMLHPYLLGNERDVTNALLGKLNAQETAVAAFEAQQNPPTPLAQGWTAFLNTSPGAGPETLKRYQYAWQKFLDWMTANHPTVLAMRDVTVKIAEQYPAFLRADKVSEKTVNKALFLLAMVWREVNGSAQIVVNPWTRDKLPRRKSKLESTKRRELTIDELRTVCQSAQGEMRLLLALGVYSGLRLSDAATLKWQEVDLGQNEIRRVPSKTAWKKPEEIIISIHPVLLSMLCETPADKRKGYVLPDTAHDYQHRVNRVTDAIQEHFQSCGIETTQASKLGRKRSIVVVGYHSLRHSHAALHKQLGTAHVVVQGLLGHSSPAMTKHYGSNVDLVASARAIAALPDIVSESKPSETKASPEATLAQIQALAQSMTVDTMAATKPQLLALLQAV